LLARARLGDSEALGALLEDERDRVFTLCYRLLGNRAEAEDAAQDAMLKVSLHLSELARDEQFGGWCWRIAHRICVDRLRKSKRRDLLAASTSVSAGPDAERRMVERIAVRRVLAAMPEDMSEVLILREMEGQTYDAIAACLGVPLGTVKSRLRSARQRFRREYAAVMQEDSQ
jgi:RNA polymerase sigma-70 factor (ECF subfamily)